MLGSIKEFKYKKVSNFCTPEETKVLCEAIENFHKKNVTEFDLLQSNIYDTKCYGDKRFDTLLDLKTKRMEEETGLKLYPTYTFFRMYTKFAKLTKHTDRPSCEISATLCLGSDGTKWPIYIDGTPIDLNPGDAAIYLGKEIPHWRDRFEGDWQAQCFLHYVDANGQYKDYKYDKRNNLGEDK